MEDIFFNEEAHKYYDVHGRNYTSVTTLIGKYEPEYDTDFWSMYTALKNKGYKVRPVPEKQSIYVSNVLYKLIHLKKDYLYSAWQQEVLAQWQVINKEACLRGNDIHNELEDSINISKGDVSGNTNSYISITGKKTIKTQHDLDQTILKDKHPFVYNRLSGYIQRDFSIFAEKRVFLEEYFVAGMIDTPIFKDKYFCILDWKTNKDELHDTSGYYKKIKVGNTWVKSDTWVQTEEYLKYPLNHIPNSKFHKYSLQLSMYAYILEKWGYILLDRGLEIIHFPLGEEPRLLKIPYLKDEVIELLNHHKSVQLSA